MIKHSKIFILFLVTIIFTQKCLLNSKAPTVNVKKNKNKDPIFVVQKHIASHLHYDFRLEIDGVLKSWAIPKGPSTKIGDKRLAIPTEDHPLDYAHFEGVIPPDSYGAGAVMVWDIGTYKNLKTKNISQCFKNGIIEVSLSGKKLQGIYALVKAKLQKGTGWLLFKISNTDETKLSASKSKLKIDDLSVLSGRSIEEIERDG